MNLTATKAFERIQEEAGESEHSLKRTLGPVNLVALGIGAIIGAGQFSLTGIAAAENAGPAVVLPFVVAALAFVIVCIGVMAMRLATGLRLYFSYGRKHGHLAGGG